VLGRLARFHVHVGGAARGALLSGADEYRYLHRSIAAFPRPAAFADLMRESGLDVLSVQPMTFGVVCLYVATPRPRA
jgi:demethylmenaquinone methyltransferase/2-methoxy-6-polyprenyl-1,4-benzoquinol methylase